jgi:hypothetical protein
MASWITTKHLLHRQDAKPLHTRNQENDEIGNLMDNMDIPWAQPCIIADVKVYIAAMASEGIVDTLKFFPHNFPMPQLSSTYRLIMKANDMSNALKNPHPKVQFSHIGDDIIAALTKLAEIFKNNFQKVQTLRLPNAPAKAAERTIPVELSHPILASPMHQRCQTSSQMIINAKDTTNAPLLPRVVTPMTSRHAPPRVPMRSQNISPRNFSQDDFWKMETSNMAIALGNHHWSQQHHANAIVHPVTGK